MNKKLKNFKNYKKKILKVLKYMYKFQMCKELKNINEANLC